MCIRDRNIGSSFQQPYQGQTTIQVQNPVSRQTIRQTLRQGQNPFTFSARSPFTSQNTASRQHPFIRSIQSPGFYIAIGRTPITYQYQSPSIYQAIGQTPTTYQAQSQSPFTYQHRQPVIYNATERSPSTTDARGQTPYQYRSPSQCNYQNKPRST